MPTNRSLIITAFVGLSALSGCAGGKDVIYNRSFTSAYSAGGLSGMREALPVQTYGAPTPGADQESVTAATLEGLKKNGPRWTQLNYSGNPQDAPSAAYYVRFAYGVSKGFPRTDLCREDLGSGDIAHDSSSGRAVAAVCRNGRYVSIAEGTPGVGVDINSAEFSNFVGLIGRGVLPRRNPDATRPQRGD